MGNGEQYIWKPPEDDDIMFQHKQMGIVSSHAGENMAASAAGVSVHLVFQVLRHILYFSFYAVKMSSRYYTFLKRCLWIIPEYFFTHKHYFRVNQKQL